MKKNFSGFLGLLLCTSLMVLVGSRALAQSGPGHKTAKPLSYGNGTAGVLFDVGVYYGQSEATANPSVGNEYKENASLYDIKLGYIREDGIYLGAGYNTRTQSSTASNLSSTTGNGAAASVGYFFENGFNVRASYLFNETFGDYKSGTGYRADLGFMLNMTSNFYLGFMISNRQVSFTENQTIAGFDKWTRKETYPFITAGFLIR